MKRTSDHIDDHCAFFSSVKLPLDPSSKGYFDIFFGVNDGTSPFVQLCDRIFGSIFDTVDSEGCWMDDANCYPNGSVASSLFHLVSPATPFVSVLESLSRPTPSFSRHLRRCWKKQSEDLETGTCYTTDFPLSSLYSDSLRLLGETDDSSLYSFSRKTVPPALFIPFWYPPIATRKEPSQQRIMSSLPCSPLAYFVSRMMVYIVKQSTQLHVNTLESQKRKGLWSILDYGSAVVSYFCRSQPSEFPFCHRVLCAYFQFYVTPSVPQHLASRTSIEDASWSSADVIGALLICEPFLLLGKHLSHTNKEPRRNACYDPCALASLCSFVPFITEIFMSLQPVDDFGSEGCGIDFHDDSLANSSSDIRHISKSFFRNTLVLFRSCIISLDRFPKIRNVHVNNLLELWLSLLNPHWRRGGTPTSNYVMQHYEVFSFITFDVLRVISNGNIIGVIDDPGALVLRMCVEVLMNPVVQKMFAAVNQSFLKTDTVSNSLQKYCLLDWSEDNGRTRLLNMHGDECADIVARVLVILDGVLQSDSSEAVKENLRHCVESLSAAFPGSEKFCAKWRDHFSTSGVQGTEAASSYVGCNKSSLMTSMDSISAKEKSHFFRGGQRPNRVFFDKVKLGTRNGSVPGNHSSATWMSCRNEFPILVGVTLFLDSVVEMMQELYFSVWIPKCERGHRMWLLRTSKYKCCNHCSETALWECTICELVYGSCCRSLPVTRSGESLSLRTQSESSSRVCHYCRELFSESSVVFSNEKVALCSDCASRPFMRLSTRWIAAYRTWAVCLLALFAYILWAIIAL